MGLYHLRETMPRVTGSSCFRRKERTRKVAGSMVRAKHRTRFAFQKRRASQRTGLPNRPVNSSRRDRKILEDSAFRMFRVTYFCWLLLFSTWTCRAPRSVQRRIRDRFCREFKARTLSWRLRTLIERRQRERWRQRWRSTIQRQFATSKMRFLARWQRRTSLELLENWQRRWTFIIQDGCRTTSWHRQSAKVRARANSKLCWKICSLKYLVHRDEKWDVTKRLL